MIIPVIPQDQFFVLRGDLIKGGAKMPALLHYLPQLHHKHFAYVGSVYGSGAWAMAMACTELGYECSLFLSRSHHIPPWLPDVHQSGAILHWCDPVPVQTLHQTVTKNYPELCNIALGFDTPEFISDMSTILRQSIKAPPHELWLSALSGVMARAAITAFPSCDIHVVSAAKHIGDVGRANIHTPPQKFHQPSSILPPYSACPYSCAKTWPLASEHAKQGAYLLNVGYGSS